MLDNAGIPLEIIDGFIGSISVSVPWTALLSESCCLDIQGLEVTIMPRQRVDTGTLKAGFYLQWSQIDNKKGKAIQFSENQIDRIRRKISMPLMTLSCL